MINSDQTISVNFICPYCKESFKKQIEYEKKSGLFNLLIKNHPKGENCPPFIAFIDNNGRHRGSQKIDNVEVDNSQNEQLLEDAQSKIDELDKTVRFYHLKVPRRGGRGFEHKVSNVQDRAFMSSKFYSQLIEFLTETESINTFGTINVNTDTYFEDGVLIYGKYLGMAYTIYWKDQKTIQSKNLEELKAHANLTVEKLLDIYDLIDFFF
ncbi:MAG: hypothetical protein ACFFB0_06965 [Promethearchaeota archaeon]